MLRNIVFIIFCIFGLVGLSAQPQAGNLLIKNGTVLTITKGTLTNTDILVQDDVVVPWAVGPSLESPLHAAVSRRRQLETDGSVDAT